MVHGLHGRVSVAHDAGRLLFLGRSVLMNARYLRVLRYGDRNVSGGAASDVFEVLRVLGRDFLTEHARNSMVSCKFYLEALLDERVVVLCLGGTLVARTVSLHLVHRVLRELTFVKAIVAVAAEATFHVGSCAGRKLSSRMNGVVDLVHLVLAKQAALSSRLRAVRRVRQLLDGLDHGLAIGHIDASLVLLRLPHLHIVVLVIERLVNCLAVIIASSDGQVVHDLIVVADVCLVDRGTRTSQAWLQIPEHTQLVDGCTFELGDARRLLTFLTDQISCVLPNFERLLQLALLG